MKILSTMNLIAAFALSTWAVAAFSQQSGHIHGAGEAVSAGASPYAGEQGRPIKSLSADDVAGLQAGAGMAYAKAAELNGYPGPARVLELASQLQLDTSQRRATEQLMAGHKSTARALGAQLIDAERALDLAFASRKIDALGIASLTQNIAKLQAALRAEHLQTHLQQTALLNPQQIASYQVLRGYQNPADARPGHPH